MMHTVNKFACEPFKENAVKVEKHGDGAFGAVKIGNSKTTLVRLEVLFDARIILGNTSSVQFIPGSVNSKDSEYPDQRKSYIWVRADLYASPYGKEIFTVNDTKFILIPWDRVEVLEAEK